MKDRPTQSGDRDNSTGGQNTAIAMNRQARNAGVINERYLLDFQTADGRGMRFSK